MKKAIYIDDDISFATPIIYTLKNLKINVLHFTSRTDALNEFDRSIPDLVILDIKLEGSLDGFDVARIIRSKSQVPILFSTGITDEEEMSKLLKFSYSDLMLKPFNINEFRLDRKSVV